MKEEKSMSDEKKQQRIRPIGTRVVVKQFAAAEKSAGGIFIPENAKEKPTEGEVLAVGDGRINERGESIPLAVKPGDAVLFNKYAGNPITVDGEEYIILQEADILGVLDKT